MSEMRILDVNDNELTEDECDLELGYFNYEQIFKEHHDAVEFKAREYHYYPKTFYFTDGTKYEVAEDTEEDSKVYKNDDNVSFGFIQEDGTVVQCGQGVLRGVDVREIEDSPQVDAKEAYDEMEDIRRYTLYTEEELAANKAAKEKQEAQTAFLEDGPATLEELTVAVADMIAA